MKSTLFLASLALALSACLAIHAQDIHAAERAGPKPVEAAKKAPRPTPNVAPKAALKAAPNFQPRPRPRPAPALFPRPRPAPAFFPRPRPAPAFAPRPRPRPPMPLPSRFVTTSADPRCRDGVSIRREIRTMSGDELRRFFRAVNILKNNGQGPSRYDDFVKLHLDNMPHAHGVPEFLPWHRFFIREFEKAIQRIDPGVSLPYWDWSVDSQSPADSAVLQDGMIGGTGRGPEECVVDGAFADWEIYYPEQRCLRRSFDAEGNISPLVPPETLRDIIAGADDFESFWHAIEASPHGALHIGVGADFASMHSPNDPVFWLHHAFVDKMWSEWQDRSSRLANDFGGAPNTGGPRVSSDDFLIPFDYPIYRALDHNNFCYVYEDDGVIMNAPPSPDRPPLNSVMDSGSEDDGIRRVEDDGARRFEDDSARRVEDDGARRFEDDSARRVGGGGGGGGGDGDDGGDDGGDDEELHLFRRDISSDFSSLPAELTPMSLEKASPEDKPVMTENKMFKTENKAKASEKKKVKELSPEWIKMNGLDPALIKSETDKVNKDIALHNADDHDHPISVVTKAIGLFRRALGMDVMASAAQLSPPAIVGRVASVPYENTVANGTFPNGTLILIRPTAPLKAPRALPENWVRMNRLNLTSVREQEHMVNQSVTSNNIRLGLIPLLDDALKTVSNVVSNIAPGLLGTSKSGASNNGILGGILGAPKEGERSSGKGGGLLGGILGSPQEGERSGMADASSSSPLDALKEGKRSAHQAPANPAPKEEERAGGDNGGLLGIL